MDLVLRAEQAAGKGFLWEAFYPTPRGPWTVVVLDGAGNRSYLAYDAGSDTFRTADPAQDPDLSRLGRWMAKGRLVSYRVGLKATVEVPRDTGLMYAKVSTEWKVKQLEKKIQAARVAAGAARHGFPRFPPVMEVADSRSVLFGALTGTTLGDRIVSSSAPEDALRATARSLVCFHEVEAPPGLPDFGSRKADIQYRTSLVAEHFPECFGDYARSLVHVLQFEELNRPAGRRSLVHNDLHDGNVVLDGDDVGLLDLEYLGAGDPCHDIGNLLAHVVLIGIQMGREPLAGNLLVDEFLSAYREAGGEVDSTRLARSIACTLHRLSCLHLFRRQLRHLCPEVLRQSNYWAGVATGARIQEPTIL